MTVFLSTLLLILTSGCSLIDAYSTRTGPSNYLYQDGQLAPCPESPNCVSTQQSDSQHAIVPFTYSKPLPEAIGSLRAEVNRLPQAKLIKEDGGYLHFEFRSDVLRLIDDVEFYFSDVTKTVEFRSSSRFGYSDWNENRKRMESIRNLILGRI